LGKALAVLAAVGLVLLLAVPAAVPIFRGFIDPYHGILGVARASGLPSGTFEAPGIPGTARVVWDQYGVPHIYATTDEAGVYAVGWVTAGMRLFQMDLLRRVGEGRLAELVGEPGLSNDEFIRSIGLHITINKTWEEIQKRPELAELKTLLEAYARGVNDYIDYAEKHDLLPVEYRVLGLKPQPWRPVDTISVAKVIALSLAWNDEDLVLEQLVKRWGPQIVAYMGLPDWSETLAQANCSMAVPWGNVSMKPNPYNYNESAGLPGAVLSPAKLAEDPGKAPDPTPILSWVEHLESFWRSLVGPLGASNNWVVAANYTTTGRPIVANDPHLELSVPPIWVLAEINTPSFKVIGALFPGTPLVVIGRNQHLAWAFTNAMGDFTDYYYLEWRGDEYLYGGEWYRATVRVEEIRVYNPVTHKYSTEEYKALDTLLGPVLESNGTRYAVRWTGLDVSFELEFFVELNNASTVREALTAQRWFHAPIQNFVVADDKGNIAYSPIGAYPIRANEPVLLEWHGGEIVNKGLIPFNGSAGEGVWVGYIPKERLPILYDPPIPFIVTANSKPWSGSCWGMDGNFVGWHYIDKYRLERITEMLTQIIREKGRVGPEDVMKVQTDYHDLGIADYLEHIILPYANDTKEAGVLREWLRETGALMSRDDYRPTIAMAWVYAYHEMLWEHLYGSTSYPTFLREYYALHIVEAAARGDSYALELIPYGNLSKAAHEALREALERLKEYYHTDDESKWVYGEIHYYNPRHPAFRALDYKKVPANGGPYTVNVAAPAEFDAREGMPVTHGPSIRQVVPLGDPIYYITLPGGQDGNPLSSHYQDIYLQFWTQDKYIQYTLALPYQQALKTYGGPVLAFQGTA